MKFILKKKMPLTLIEVSIAFGLMAVIIFALFFSFRSSSLMAVKLNQIKIPLMEKQFCYQRLLNVFSQLERDSLHFEEKALSFSFKNDLDPEFSFSGMVQSQIALEKGGNLVLITSSSKNEGEERKELLLSHVKSADWEIKKTYLRLSFILENEKEPKVLTFFLANNSNDGVSV